MTFHGIALPSLLLAFAVRRWIAPVTWRLIGLFLALTFAFLHGAVFTSKLPVPVDEVARGLRTCSVQVRMARLICSLQCGR